MSFIENPIYVLAVLCLMVLLSMQAAKTRLGGKLSAALMVIIFTAVLANLKLIPSASNSIPLYGGIFKYLASIGIFYLLLEINLPSLKKAGAPMIILFLIGSLATILGILGSWYLVSPGTVLGDKGAIVAGMLTGTYTGGSVNFNAIALEYDFHKEGALYAGTIAVDNVITTIWIIVTLAIPAIMRPLWADKKIAVKAQKEDHEQVDALTLESMLWLFFLGAAAFYVSELIKLALPQIPFILILSTIGILLAQIPFISKLGGSRSLGIYTLYLFLAVIGAYCEIEAVLELQHTGLTLLLFTALAVLFHGIITIGIGGLTFRDWDMVAITSQANVGGSTSAIAIAESLNRNELVLPAILVGTLGNAVGTYFGFLVVGIL
ncbi:MAG: DUF819 family protein [Maribacter sp.]|uniref:DUF819 family protein n=1 Tax=Maribacter sp. 2307UL18-2 TaxID=3386274 RepID=UPI0039BCF267